MTAINDGSGPNYINDQHASPVADVPVGLGNVSWSGCGPVATYNALLTLNDKVDLEEVIDYYENNGYLLFEGLMGTPPVAVRKFFEDRGYKVIKVVFSQENAETVRWLSQNADASIMWYAYTHGFNDLLIGAHFIEYHKSGSSFIGHNTSAGVSIFDNPYAYGLRNTRFLALSYFIFKED